MHKIYKQQIHKISPYDLKFPIPCIRTIFNYTKKKYKLESVHLFGIIKRCKLT